MYFQDEENEFDHFNDEEEFEGFQTGSSKTDEKELPKITITKVCCIFLKGISGN